ncbi:YHYH domain-containing protein [Paenibacillus sinopodophylli]|uniref:YHYH domain-containing protein n=1 Tax=Paenibacillus sinopodophylli TaxID=1837342 RepID=UPI001FE94F80|nr:YHYH domain-containing protein [Paenibacillus sinopodophylli]
MKKSFVALAFTLLMFVFISYPVSSHPGRTDANGGHTCRTNCERWGLEYGEYHFHNTVNRTNKTEDNSIMGAFIIWGIVGAIVIYYIAKFIRNTSFERPVRKRIDITPALKEPPPPDEPITFSGVIIKRVYRKVPFFVARFINNEGECFTIVGNYEDRLSINKEYVIEGVITHHPRYGQQIKVKKIIKK